MAKKTIKAQMKQRRDTKANWEATNPVLLDGELGIVSDDPNLYKVGDGATAWNSLPFRGFDGTLAQELGTSPNAVISQKVVSEKLTELESEVGSKHIYSSLSSSASNQYILGNDSNKWFPINSKILDVVVNQSTDANWILIAQYEDLTTNYYPLGESKRINKNGLIILGISIYRKANTDAATLDANLNFGMALDVSNNTTKVAELVAKDAELSAKDAELSAKDAELSAKDAELISAIGIVNVNALGEDKYADYTLASAIAAVPSEYRGVAKGVAFRSGATTKIALFSSVGFINLWEDLSRWMLFDIQQYHRYLQVINSQPVGVERTPNLFDWRTAPNGLNVYAYSGGYTIEENSISLVVAPIKKGERLWWKLWVDNEQSLYNDFGLSEFPLIRTIEGESFDNDSMWVDIDSHAPANVRGNMTSTIDGIMVMSFRFKTLADKVNNFISLMKTLTVRIDDYGDGYIDYYQLQTDNSLQLEVATKLSKNLGSNNAGKALIVGANGDVIPSVLSPDGTPTEDVHKIVTTKLPIGQNLLGAKTLGAGWSESGGILSHSSGEEPIVFDYETENGVPYIIKLSMTPPSEEAIWVTIGDYPKIDTYYGNEDVVLGLVSTGGKLQLYPFKTWSGKIKSISLHRLVTEDDAIEVIEYQSASIATIQGAKDYTSKWNVAISGSDDALSNTENATRNVAIGYNSLRQLKTGTRNVAVGTFSMANLIYGDRNIAIGSDSLWFTNHAEDCIAVGKNCIGSMNLALVYKKCVAVGNNTLANVKNDCTNVIAIGYRAMAGTEEVGDSVALGNEAGNYAKTQCVAIGQRAGYYQKGDQNTCIGAETYRLYVNGSRQTIIGANAKPSQYDASLSANNIKTMDNIVVIGAGAKADKPNQSVIGNTDTVETKVFGDLVVEGTDGVKRQIIFNADGTCSWQTL